MNSYDIPDEYESRFLSMKQSTDSRNSVNIFSEYLTARDNSDRNSDFENGHQTF